MRMLQPLLSISVLTCSACVHKPSAVLRGAAGSMHVAGVEA